MISTMKAPLIALFSLASIAAAAQEPQQPGAAMGPVQSSAYKKTMPTPEESSTEPTDNISVEKAAHDLSAQGGIGFRGTKNAPYNCAILDFELEYARVLHPRHAFTLSMGYATGGRNHNGWIVENGERRSFSDNFDRRFYSLMGGYRFTQPLDGQRCRLYLGAKGGLDIQSLNVDIGRDWRRDDKEYESDMKYNPSTGEYESRKKKHHGRKDFAFGAAYSAYAGIEWKIDKNMMLSLGYAYRGTTSKPDARLSYPAGTGSTPTKALRWHEIRLGITGYF